MHRAQFQRSEERIRDRKRADEGGLSCGMALRVLKRALLETVCIFFLKKREKMLASGGDFL